MINDITPHKATIREWIGLAVLAVPCLVYAMDLTVLMLAIPSLSADLNPSASQLLWITDIYGFFVSGFLITMGTLGDRIGGRRLLMIGAGCFAVASIFAAFATSAEMLIVARAILGIAGATLAPSTLSLIRNMFHDDHQRTLAIGIWVSCFSGGATLGPVIGGVILQYFWWGSVFLMAVPVMIIVLILGPRLLPETRDPNAGRIDLTSVFLSLTAVIAAIYGIKKIAENGFDLTYMICIFIGAVIGFIFVRRQKNLADPMVDVSLFKQPGFSAALSINIIGLFMTMGFFLLTAQYLQMVLNLTPLEAGLWMIPTGIVFILGSTLCPLLVRRVRRVYVLAAGFAIASIGFVVVSQIADLYSVHWFVLAVLIFCFGLSPVGALTTDIVLSIAPANRAGAASAISETSFEFGAAAGIAIVGSVAMALYSSLMSGLAPIGTPPEALDTLSGALQAAKDMDSVGDDGAALVDIAQASFTRALIVAAWMAAAASMVASIMSIALLRKYRVRAS